MGRSEFGELLGSNYNLRKFRGQKVIWKRIGSKLYLGKIWDRIVILGRFGVENLF